MPHICVHGYIILHVFVSEYIFLCTLTYCDVYVCRCANICLHMSTLLVTCALFFTATFYHSLLAFTYSLTYPYTQCFHYRKGEGERKASSPHCFYDAKTQNKRTFSARRSVLKRGGKGGGNNICIYIGGQVPNKGGGDFPPIPL